MKLTDNIKENLSDLPQQLSDQLKLDRKHQLDIHQEQLTNIQNIIDQLKKDIDQITNKSNAHLNELILKSNKIAKNTIKSRIINILIICIISTIISTTTCYFSIKYFKPFVSLNNTGNVTIDKSNVSIWKNG